MKMLIAEFSRFTRGMVAVTCRKNSGKAKRDRQGSTGDADPAPLEDKLIHLSKDESDLFFDFCLMYGHVFLFFFGKSCRHYVLLS